MKIARDESINRHHQLEIVKLNGDVILDSEFLVTNITSDLIQFDLSESKSYQRSNDLSCENENENEYNLIQLNSIQFMYNN
jgi:hypothetical protein